MVKFGVIGAGNISKKFLYTLNALKITPYAIASRDYKKALSYQKEYNIKKAYGSYHDLVADPLVEAVYIATPH
ncbi:Gfo/Idh/MocA family oxidoreductase, partial [Methanocalculus natronophilus]|uniref:Gfo/Idh/MocA family oxidoreductase n=1 Tax=Methanocalculus natronophilus TaxID=1262400 RepID=UPI0031B5720E